MTDHVLLMAFHVTAEDSDPRPFTNQRAQENLLPFLTRPGQYLRDAGVQLDSWWVAEDDRIDGSDNDSAVFVSPGAQREATALLHKAGLSPDCNLWDEERVVRGQFEADWERVETRTPTETEAKVATITAERDSAQRDYDKAGDVEDCNYYAGLLDAYNTVLGLLHKGA